MHDKLEYLFGSIVNIVNKNKIWNMQNHKQKFIPFVFVATTSKRRAYKQRTIRKEDFIFGTWIFERTADLLIIYMQIGKQNDTS